MRGYSGGADKVFDGAYDAPKAILFADFDNSNWWIYAEYYFGDLSDWMDAYNDGNPAEPFNYLYEPYFAAAWWFSPVPFNYNFRG